MKVAAESTEKAVLRGLLLLLVEVQNILRDTTDTEKGEKVARLFGKYDQISELAESPHAAELIARARKLLETPKNRRTFYGIVNEQDLPKGHREEATARGPILMEVYLDAQSIAADRDKTEEFARAHGFARYGWVAIAEISVEIPDPPAAIPAAAAGVHA